VLSRFTDGEETPGNSGAPTLPVDADHSYHSHSINYHILTAIKFEHKMNLKLNLVWAGIHPKSTLFYLFLLRLIIHLI
jgi:hypothetical protein